MARESKGGEEKRKERKGMERKERGGGVGENNKRRERQTEEKGEEGKRGNSREEEGMYVIRVRTDDGGRERHTREKHITKGGEGNEDWQESKMKYGTERKK